MNLFDRANHALRHDLEAYAQALDSIVTVLPRAKELCDQVVKETRLARALLAFTDNQQLSELNQLAFHLTNLWPYRDQSYTRTVGFGDEIAEAQRQREEALRAVRLLARLKGDPLAIEVSACFSNIANNLEQERALLAECHALIQPHASNMDMTRKRLNLLVAMVDARLPASEEQAAMLFAYQAAAAVLSDWENGVPLEERGVEILTRCLRMLEQVDQVIEEETDEVYVDAAPD
jgi:hypothetical protein